MIRWCVDVAGERLVEQDMSSCSTSHMGLS